MTESTIKLFDEDAYKTEFDAQVVWQCMIEDAESEGLSKILLDQTLFFPEEGGQEADLGTINGFEVIDVQIEKKDQKELIFHTIKGKLNVGDVVHGVIDFEHRFDQMQQHSGEHIFSGTVHNRFGYDNVGFHLSRQSVTMDFNGPLDDDEVRRIEREVNEIIVQNLEIKISWPSKKELEKLEYRSKKELEGDVRIVTIPGVDVCACCAPHVKRTGEIGFLKVISRQNYKNGVRITIECGLRALETLSGEHSLLQNLAKDLTTSLENVPGQVLKMKDEIFMVKGKLQKTNKELMEYKLRDIPSDKENVTIFTDDIDNRTAQDAINALTKEHKGYCSFFIRTDTGYRFVSASSGKDAWKIAMVLKEKFAAKGGGSDKMVQGSLDYVAEDEIINAIDMLKD